MRINQFVAAASGLSRRAADQAITDGRVIVNNQAVKRGAQVSPSDHVMLDDQPLTFPDTRTYLMLHKPAGYVTSRTRQGSDPTVYELLPERYHKLRPVGRLDRDSSGLLLLSDDGNFIYRHTHPSEQHEKIYELHLARAVAAPDLQRLEQGVELADGPSRLRIISHHGADLIVGLSEGRNRQLRRTLGALGYAVERLHRTSVGDYALGDLEPGQWLQLEVTA